MSDSMAEGPAAKRRRGAAGPIEGNEAEATGVGPSEAEVKAGVEATGAEVEGEGTPAKAGDAESGDEGNFADLQSEESSGSEWDRCALEDPSSDDSEDDAPRNRIGNVPLEWYADEDHVGYDLAGKKVMKTLSHSEIDALLESKDNPNAWRTIKDHKNQREIVLTDTDLEVIRRIRKRMYVSDGTETTNFVEFDNPLEAIHPTRGEDPPKRRFLPSKWERMKVKRLVALLREGKIRPPPPPKPEVWDLWSDEGPRKRRGVPQPLPAPKLPLPGHAESYNPPTEYLFTEQEKKEWEDKDETERKLSHIPAKYEALRRVPAYQDFVLERFKRCLDLYLVPRALKQRMNVDPESLLPKLPSPKDLRPFPTHIAVNYEGHTGMVRSISVDITGQWIATASLDNTVKIWEVSSGRCFRSLSFTSPATAVAWCPRNTILALAAEEKIFFADPGLQPLSKDGSNVEFKFEPPEEEGPTIEDAISEEEGEPSALDPQLKLRAAALEPADREEGEDDEEAEKKEGAKARAVRWKTIEKESHLYKEGCRISIATDGDVVELTWHNKGNYCAAVSPKAKASSNQCIIHSLHQQKSMRPFHKLRSGQVQSCAFHPSKPHFLVATKTSVRVYDLQKQMPLKQLMSGAKWISSISMHPSGDHVAVASYCRRLVWFDLDLSRAPYKTLQYHDRAVRCTAFHPGKYPLLAAASDDATVSILHAKVYSDLMQSPMIVPVKRLRDHAVHQGFGVLSCAWHPTQPWLFTAGADHRVFLWA